MSVLLFVDLFLSYFIRWLVSVQFGIKTPVLNSASIVLKSISCTVDSKPDVSSFLSTTFTGQPAREPPLVNNKRNIAKYVRLKYIPRPKSIRVFQFYLNISFISRILSLISRGFKIDDTLYLPMLSNVILGRSLKMPFPANSRISL